MQMLDIVNYYLMDIIRLVMVKPLVVLGTMQVLILVAVKFVLQDFIV